MDETGGSLDTASEVKTASGPPLLESEGINPAPVVAGVRDISAIANVLLEGAPDAIVIVEADGVIAYINEQALTLFGYERPALMGKSVEMVIPGDLGGGHKLFPEKFASQLTRRSMGTGLDLYAVAKGGSRIPIEVSLSPINTTFGPLVMAVVRDVTELRAAALEKIQVLERENSRVNQLLSIISHELKTPITIAKGLIENLQDGKIDAGGKDMGDYMAKIKQAVIDLELKVGAIIQLQACQAGKQQLTLSNVSLADVMQEVEGDLDELLGIRHVILKSSIEGSLPEIWADAKALHLIFVNLVKNAIDASPEGSVVEIGAKRQDEYLVCNVTDHGIGISEEDLSRLFLPFTQLDMSDSRPINGMGVGLSLIRELVQAHHGDLGVDSRKGQGSRFWFTIPIAPAPSAQALE